MSKALKPLNTLRKSLPNSSKGGTSVQGTFHLQPKSPEIMNPPKKVIKALYDYTAESPEELSFIKGDFFMVVANENDEFWYLASNPNTGARGLVPVSYFQIMAHMVHPVPQNPALANLNPPHSRTSSPLGVAPGGTVPTARRNSRARPQQPQIYGTVLYDFDAERPDELAAKTGDHVIIIAQSNEDWFVAKPINRIGGPGLLPVSFIQVRDLKTGQPVTNLHEMLRANNIKLPGVAEWKRETMEQDRQHIPLGVVANSGPAQSYPGAHRASAAGPIAVSGQRVSRASVSSSGSHGTPGPYAPRQSSLESQDPSYRAAAPRTSMDTNGEVPTISPAHCFVAEEVAGISVVSFKNKGDRFYFQIQMAFQDGTQRILFRLYEEFYQFQVYLLEEFPKEAGRMDEPRTLPFMPGPLSFVNETITAQRRVQLDEYLRSLFQQPSYIINSAPFQNFLAPRGEDIEIAAPSTVPSLHPSSVGSGSPSREERYRSGSSSISGTHTLADDKRVSSPTIVGATSASIKVKVMYNADLVAIRITLPMTLTILQERIGDRLNIHVGSLAYRDADGEFITIHSEEDLQDVLADESNRTRLVVRVTSL
ncbi:hypothetical protein BJ085DRAFT_13961 [Dimargaris cristalligena]|uniref:Uncharacterized protein n=1 Tax=Dimargaris cristalligena TaxID=215637 RepID=A0A4P9ZLH3_9FUNG|nr:hypothetical protein BJ085DRAFT_13961 [Dimargaris cristalligena]|eukprot:RKP33983.1 hypothetical protein BJ085DRAFT_13961 [Dimargaris cristalligena]